MEELSYKDLQLKAKELGMPKVIAVGADELKAYIDKKTSSMEGLETPDDSTLIIGDQVDVITGESETPKSSDKISPNNQEVEENDTDIYTKNEIAKTRGFKNLAHAKSYLECEEFKKLSEPDQFELKKWFKSI